MEGGGKRLAQVGGGRGRRGGRGQDGSAPSLTSHCRSKGLRTMIHGVAGRGTVPAACNATHYLMREPLPQALMSAPHLLACRCRCPPGGMPPTTQTASKREPSCAKTEGASWCVWLSGSHPSLGLGQVLYPPCAPCAPYPPCAGSRACRVLRLTISCTS